MAGSPRKRQRREIHEAGEAARESFHEEARQRLLQARRDREEAERASGASKGDIRTAALDKFWPMAEQVVERALRGEEVNREQLNAAFKILEQQLGRPGQNTEDPAKDKPSVIVYESAAFLPMPA